MIAPAEDRREDRARLIQRLRQHATTATALGSPLYADLFGHIAEDVNQDGPCWQVLRHFAHQRDGEALPLRFMAAMHRLVLRRQVPELAMHYASVGGTAGVEGAWAPFVASVHTHHDALVRLTALPCQTNEVGRSAALGPGLAWLAGRHDLPLNHLEIGTSAGLNLRWDRFRYGTADRDVTWGPADSPVDLTGHWVVAPRDLPSAVEVASRRGCDPNLLDPTDEEDRETLTASVWADLAARHERLKGALALAAQTPASTVARPAGEWLAEILPRRPADGLTVVAHSVVWRYIPEAEQRAIEATLRTVGAQADAAAPLVWLRLEPRPPRTTYDGTPYPLLATTWPGGATEELATAHAWGTELRWRAAPLQ